MVGFGGIGGAADCSAAVLTFLGRPFGRSGLATSIFVEGDWGSVRSVEADVGSSVVKAFGNEPCRAILAANDSSTSLASSADRRFLAFRRATARGCRSSF